MLVLTEQFFFSWVIELVGFIKCVDEISSRTDLLEIFVKFNLAICCPSSPELSCILTTKSNATSINHTVQRMPMLCDDLSPKDHKSLTGIIITIHVKHSKSSHSPLIILRGKKGKTMR